jgi:hypothetical protein
MFKHGHNNGWNWSLAALLTVCLLLLASCGGAAGSDLSGGSALDSDNGSKTDSRALPLGAPLPQLPVELAQAESSRGTSLVGEHTYPGSGAALLNYSGGVIESDSLILTSSETEEAWAMYRADDLANLWVTVLGVLTVPGDLDTTWYTAVSNFTNGTWDWVIESKLPEIDCNLRDNPFRLVSPLGNLYWVVAVPAGGKTLEIQLSKVLTEQFNGGGWLPGGEQFLFASQGLPAVVELQWGEADGQAGYEVWRREAPAPQGDPSDPLNRPPGGGDPTGPEFVKIADVTGNSFSDYEAVFWQPYEYKVRALNDRGFGGFSNVALGWAADPAGGGDPNQGDASACGQISVYTDTALQLVLPDGDGFFNDKLDFNLTADTIYIDRLGNEVDHGYFSVSMQVFVMAEFDANGYRNALAVMEDCRGGGNENFAVGAITILAPGQLQIAEPQTGVQYDFSYDELTLWLDSTGNELTPDEFTLGDEVAVTYAVNPDGNYALQVQQYGGGNPGGGQFDISGEITNIGQEFIDVNCDPGLAYHLLTGPDTLWFDENGNEISPENFQVGDYVGVTVLERADGSLFALVVRLGGFPNNGQ